MLIVCTPEAQGVNFVHSYTTISDKLKTGFLFNLDLLQFLELGQVRLGQGKNDKIVCH